MDFINRMMELEKNNQPYTIATIVKAEGSVPGKIGFKILVDTAGQVFGTVGGGSLEKRIISDSLVKLKSGESGLEEYTLTDKPHTSAKKQVENVVPMMCNGKVSVFFELHHELPAVYLFGGGHVGNAVLYHLHHLPIRAILIDNRKEYANPEKNPYAHQYINQDYRKFAKEFTPADNSFIIIMTHEHTYDYDILSHLYKNRNRVNYIGVIASKSKAAKTIDKLKKEFGSKINLGSLYMPIGLDLGGNTAAEIALSIAAEIQTVLQNRPANHLSVTKENS